MFVTAYDKTYQVRPVYEPEVDPETGEPISKTKQDDVEACNINNIMKKYQRDGLVTHLSKFAPSYGNASQVEYLEAFELLNTADSVFDTLPSTVRARFENDPALWLGAIEDAGSPEALKAILSGEEAQDSPVEPTPAPQPEPEPSGDPEPT